MTLWAKPLRRRSCRRVVTLSLVVMLVAVAGHGNAAGLTEPAITTRVSVAVDGTPGNGSSSAPTLSGDGRHVAFVSGATNLVAADTNAASDVFVHDRDTGETTRVSGSSGGGEANVESGAPAISADGRHVVFVSKASNLVPGDTNDRIDVFVHDRETGETTRVSVATDGSEANQDSSSRADHFFGSVDLVPPAISADGRHVAFVSEASNLVSGDTNDAADVFVHDRETGETTRVSVASDGTQADWGVSTAVDERPGISLDGRLVVFTIGGHVFVHDRETGETTLVSVDTNGDPADGGWPAISGDGRHVAFVSLASNVVPGDTNALLDVFVRDRQTGETVRVSVASDGTQAVANWPDWFTPALSDDGRFVAFNSWAHNLVPGPIGQSPQVYVHDRQLRETTRVSTALDGHEAQSYVLDRAISGDGHHVAFSSDAGNLVPGDANDVGDVFVRSDSIGFTARFSAETCATLETLAADLGFGSVENLIRTGVEGFRAVAAAGGATPIPVPPVDDGACAVAVAWPEDRLDGLSDTAEAWGVDEDQLHHLGGRIVLVVLYLGIAAGNG